jgi:hypothetical protein
MSDGGLLQKALEQQEKDNSGNNELMDAKIPVSSNTQKSDGNHTLNIKNMPSLKKIGLSLALGGLLPLVVIMWFGIYLIPDAFPITIITPLISIISLVSVWVYLGIGLPSNFGGSGIHIIPAVIVTTSYLFMLLMPAIMGMLLVGDMSIGDVEINDEGTELEVKIRQNGGSSSPIDAVVVIGTYSQTMQLKIDKSDGYGDYGKLLLPISDFYSGNALPSSDYILEITIEDKTMSIILNSKYLSRTIDDVQSHTNGIISEDSDDCGSFDNCVIGVSLVSWAGLDSNDRPASLPLANYNLSATLFYENGNTAIAYPTVSVTGSHLEPFAVASWDSNSGEFGSGNYVIGDYGSELPLQGSTEEPNFGGFKYVPKDQWEESRYGCYYFVVEVTQDNTWTNEEIVSHTSYYNYIEETAPGEGGGSTESWAVSSDPC